MWKNSADRLRDKKPRPGHWLTREKMVVILVITACLLVVLAGMYSGTPLENYIPKSHDEAAIISLIRTFHRAGTEYDLKTYLACLDDPGSYMFSGTKMVSKAELALLLPPFWEDLKSGNMLPRPICRESLNGNFFKGALYDPLISVTGQKANAAVTFVTPVIRWKTLLFIDLERQKGIWKITHFKWDMG